MRKSAPFRFGSLEAKLPPIADGLRVGLMGGSFNPPHAAHRLISDIALSRLGLDQIWWIVTPGNPLKNHSELLPLEERMRLSRSLAGASKVIVTDFERGLRSSFTAATIGHARLRFPGAKFVWIMGADCLAGFHRWQHWDDILQTVPVAVIDRPGWRHKALSSRAAHRFGRFRIPEDRARLLPNLSAPAWVFLTGPLLPISSTEIRQKARLGTGGRTQWKMPETGRLPSMIRLGA